MSWNDNHWDMLGFIDDMSKVTLTGKNRSGPCCRCARELDYYDTKYIENCKDGWIGCPQHRDEAPYESEHGFFYYTDG